MEGLFRAVQEVISTIPEWVYWVMGLGSITGLLGQAVQVALARRKTRHRGRPTSPDEAAREGEGRYTRPKS